MDIEPALVPYIVFSDHLIREQGSGKLSLIGTFGHLNVPSFPFVTPPFFVTIGITNLRKRPENGLHITIRIEHPANGHVFNSVSGKISFKEEAVVDAITMFEMPIPVPSFTITEGGVYVVKVLIDNEEVGKRTLPVRVLTAAAETE